MKLKTEHILEVGGICVGRGIFKTTPPKGDYTKDLSQLSKVYYAYDIKHQYRLSVYADMKGTANSVFVLPYCKEYTPVEEYSNIISTATYKFHTANPHSDWYDVILVPDSRSILADQVVVSICTNASAHSRTARAAILRIPKLTITLENTLEVVDWPELVKHAFHCIKCCSEDIVNYVGEESCKMSLRRAVNQYVDKFVAAHQNQQFSNATHFRPVPCYEPFKDLLRIYDIPLCAISGHLDKFVKSYYDTNMWMERLAQIEETKNKIGTNFKLRILIVDDNINTGDIYKQLKPIYTKYPNTDWFFLMKSDKYGN